MVGFARSNDADEGVGSKKGTERERKERGNHTRKQHRSIRGIEEGEEDEE